MCESYEKAALPLESKLRFAVCALTAGCSVGLLFYDRIAAALLLSILLLGFFPLYRERERKRDRMRCCYSFGMYSMRFPRRFPRADR